MRRNIFTSKLTAAALCVGMLFGSVPAHSVYAAEAAESDDLVDIYCSQSAIDALGEEQLRTLLDLIVTSIEPQAVNLLTEKFDCFGEAAKKDELGREIGLYIYYETGDQDGYAEHEDAAPGSYAYVSGYMEYQEEGCEFKYLICIDASTISEPDGKGQAVLTIDDRTRVQLDTTFCHELFHAFMDDYNRAGMSGYTDPDSYFADQELDLEESEQLYEETLFPYWFMEGMAGCVGNIYPADLALFTEYSYDLEAQEYLDYCTDEQLCTFYANQGYWEETGEDRYDLEAAGEDNGDGHVNGATYTSGYMACLYLADLAYQKDKKECAVVFDENGGIESVSSEKLRDGLSSLLTRLHRGDTLDKVIKDVSGGRYKDTADFTKRFIKGNYNEKTQTYDGDPESLDFCVGFLNYMYEIDGMDPETHPAGSVLLDDFVSTETTPLKKDRKAESEFYRFSEQNTYTVSTVSNEECLKDGGTSYTAKDSFDKVVEQYQNAHEKD